MSLDGGREGGMEGGREWREEGMGGRLGRMEVEEGGWGGEGEGGRDV